MAYANLKSKRHRKGWKPAVYEEYGTGWGYLFRLLRFLRLKGLASILFPKPRRLAIIFKDGVAWKGVDRGLKKRFKIWVVGKVQDPTA